MKDVGIIFDLDGTLLDTVEDIANSMNRVLDDHNLPTHPVDSYRKFIGKGVVNLLVMATGLPADNPDCLTIGKEFREDYSKHWMDRTQLYPEIPFLLDHLSEVGAHMAVLTNKYQEYANLNREVFLNRWPIDPFLGATPDLPLKPDPAGIYKIADHWNYDLKQIYYIGDTDTDMQTALAAGVFAIGAGWGFRGLTELELAGADLAMESPAELWTWFRDNVF